MGCLLLLRFVLKEKAPMQCCVGAFPFCVQALLFRRKPRMLFERWGGERGHLLAQIGLIGAKQV